MTMFVKFNFNKICTKVLEEILTDLGIKYQITNFGEVQFLEKPSIEAKKKLEQQLKHYGIEIIEDQKTALVQKIKDVIVEMIYSNEPVFVKSSIYLSEKLKHSYGYLSNIFSEVTYTSIENFIILHKIEFAKQLMITENLTLTDIAQKLHYSSVAHLSSQFKNTTGITPSQFQKIIKKRRAIANS